MCTMRTLFGVALVGLLTTSVAIAGDNGGTSKSTDRLVTSTNTISGRCRCGDITYEADGGKAKSDDCDCRGCQRASGALKAQYVIVPPSDLKITAGTPTEFRAKPSKDCDGWGIWMFCQKCGTPLFWKANKGGQIDIFAGTLDDSSVYRPKM